MMAFAVVTFAAVFLSLQENEAANEYGVSKLHARTRNTSCYAGTLRRSNSMQSHEHARLAGQTYNESVHRFL